MIKLDAVSDSRWPAFLGKHPEASVFHSPGWLDALRRTYGYAPIVYANGDAQGITDAIVFCRIDSWITGRRLVSVPFSDHCQPLVRDFSVLRDLLDAIQQPNEIRGCKYVELRPAEHNATQFKQAGFTENLTIYLHKLDLRPDLDTIFRGLHRTHVRPHINRAQRQLTYEEGRSQNLLLQFYSLQVLTRRRHGLPPQPLGWFRNLMDCLGDALTIRIASKDGRPVASIMTLSYKQSMIYKYGCSDAQFNNLGGTLLLLWRAIVDAKAQGALEFDFGRSDLDNPGLVSFKDHWGTSRSIVTYYRFPANLARRCQSGFGRAIAKYTCNRLPDRILTAMGSLLYPHAG